MAKKYRKEVMKMKTRFTAVLAIILTFAVAMLLTACNVPTTEASPDALTKLTVGASPAPHAEILEFVKPALAEAGYDLEIIVFTDYVLPNTALQAGELDANYFQHVPYLINFNKENNTDLASAVEIHFEPLGIYAGRSDDLGKVAMGAELGVPADTTNEARALQLLAAQGLITLKEGVGLEATPLDIVDNPRQIKFFESEAALLPRVLKDVDFAIINGNYAIDAAITDKILAAESSDSEGAQRFCNVVAVKRGNENTPGVQALIKALTTDATRQFILDKYDGYVVPVF
jgi:D-methionine transport system substrate-binding protein